VMLQKFYIGNLNVIVRFMGHFANKESRCEAN
jgi:hypothetical protein